MNTPLSPAAAKLLRTSVLVSVAYFCLFVPSTQAAVSTWYKGASVLPQSQTEFASDGFKESMRNLKAMGGTHVNFVIPYYQSNTQSTDIGRGWNTPTDESLIAGIQYVKSIGLQAQISIYLETYSHEWRAYINPQGTNRATWYRNYGDVLVYYGRIGEQQGVALFQLGAEMVNVSSGSFASSNTTRWNEMIARVRQVYSGKLTYSANRAQPDEWANEAPNIGFWDKMDYIGISAYYRLDNGDGSPEAVKNQWLWIDNNYLKPLERFGKPLLFTEVGYRSVDNARFYPWDHSIGGPYDPEEQTNLYKGLFEYWNGVPRMGGIVIWWWSSNPQYGGSGNTDYTPQNKPVQDVIKQWWSGGSTTPQPSPVFSATGAGTSTSGSVGQALTLTASVTNTGGAASDIIVDFEVYSGNTRVFQDVVSGQAFSAGQTRQLTRSWTPSSSGTYAFKIGVFNGNWTQTYTWNNSAATITIGSGGSTPPPPPTGSATTEIWWPSDGARVTGVQPFKALVQGKSLSEYSMYWRVDNGGLVQMYDSQQDWPHKEALVDLSGWNWKGVGPYTITFVSKDAGGATISERSVQILVQ